MIHTCWCVAHGDAIATTIFPPNTWGKTLLLCTTHADTNRQGHSFPVYTWRTSD